MAQRSSAAHVLSSFVLPPAILFGAIAFLGNVVWSDMRKRADDQTIAINALASEVSDLKIDTRADRAVQTITNADDKRRLDVLEAWQRARQ